MGEGDAWSHHQYPERRPVLWAGLALAALSGVLAAAGLAVFRSHERAQQDEIEELQSEIEEVARWVDTDS